MNAAADFFLLEIHLYPFKVETGRHWFPKLVGPDYGWCLANICAMQTCIHWWALHRAAVEKTGHHRSLWGFMAQALAVLISPVFPLNLLLPGLEKTASNISA